MIAHKRKPCGSFDRKWSFCLFNRHHLLQLSVVVDVLLPLLVDLNMADNLNTHSGYFLKHPVQCNALHLSTEVLNTTPHGVGSQHNLWCVFRLR